MNKYISGIKSSLFPLYQRGRSSRQDDGFTVIEIIVAFSIIIIAVALGYQGLNAFNETTAVTSGTEEALAILDDARNRVVSARNKSQFGVHLAGDRLILFPGAVYNSSDPANEIHLLSPRIEIAAIALAGGSVDIVFQRSTGQTAQYGTFLIRSRKNTTIFRTIAVLRSGLAMVREQ